MSLNSQQTALFNQLLEGTLLTKDVEPLVTWLGKEELDAEAIDLILMQLQKSVDQNKISEEVRYALDARLITILESKPQKKSIVYNLRSKWLQYAAALIILLSGALLYWSLQRPSTEKIIAVNKPLVNDIQPGKQGAILTLGDGSTVLLDSARNGVIAKQNGSKLLLNNGALIYNPDGAVASEVSYNTITTPKGRQFQLVLSDGTRVWLNAASSLRYPAVFNGNERKVEVTGEVYFEVAKNPNKPFRVRANNDTEIRVLGTHFNVNAYKNEDNLTTTLLEGSVQITNGSKQSVLKPGQQAQIAGKQSSIKIVDNADLEKVMAWKNGVFDFDNANLEEVMRQIERWYDVDVVYEKGIPKLEFVGKMGRDLTLSEVLRGLELSKVHFRIEERKLVILP